MTFLPLQKNTQGYELVDEANEELHHLESSHSKLRSPPYLKICSLVIFWLAWTYLVGSVSYRVGKHYMATEHQEPNIEGIFMPPSSSRSMLIPRVL
jgi:hypothetical protein